MFPFSFFSACRAISTPHKQLKKGGAACIDDVFFAFLGSDGILHIQRKHETGGEAVYIHTEKKGTEKEK